MINLNLGLVHMKQLNSKILLSTLALFSISPAWADESFSFTTHGDYTYYVADQANPELTLKRGITYQFQMNTPGHPLWIKTKLSPGVENAFNNGITANGTDKGVITFVVAPDAPDELIYNCQYHVMMHGVIHIIN